MYTHQILDLFAFHGVETFNMSVSAKLVRDNLSVKYKNNEYILLLDGEFIGHMVRYVPKPDAQSGGGKTNKLPKTICASRIYNHGAKIEEKATNTRSLLNKVANRIFVSITIGVWTGPNCQKTPLKNKMSDSDNEDAVVDMGSSVVNDDVCES